MKTSSPRINRIELQAMTLAVLFHVFLINLCIFTFPLRSSAFKPEFIFLGSILESYDFTILTDKEKSPTYSPKTDVHIQPNLSKFDPKGITTVSKPEYSHGLKISQKEYVKSTFLTDKPELTDKSREDVADELGIDIRKPIYNPLSSN